MSRERGEGVLNTRSRVNCRAHVLQSVEGRSGQGEDDVPRGGREVVVMMPLATHSDVQVGVVRGKMGVWLWSPRSDRGPSSGWVLPSGGRSLWRRRV